MLKLWKVNVKTGDATVGYPFAPLETNKDMRGKPEHSAEMCIACGACAVACPPDAIHMDTDLDAGSITWSLNYGRCIFCGRCEEACPMGAVRLTEEFELAVMSKDDLMSRSVYSLARCSVCGEPFAPAKEVDYAARLLAAAGGIEAGEAASMAGVCTDCKRALDAERAAEGARASNSGHLGIGAPKSADRMHLGGHGLNSPGAGEGTEDAKEAE